MDNRPVVAGLGWGRGWEDGRVWGPGGGSLCLDHIGVGTPLETGCSSVRCIPWGRWPQGLWDLPVLFLMTAMTLQLSQK